MALRSEPKARSRLLQERVAAGEVVVRGRVGGVDGDELLVDREPSWSRPLVVRLPACTRRTSVKSGACGQDFLVEVELEVELAAVGEEPENGAGWEFVFRCGRVRSFAGVGHGGSPPAFIVFRRLSGPPPVWRNYTSRGEAVKRLAVRATPSRGGVMTAGSLIPNLTPPHPSSALHIMCPTRTSRRDPPSAIS